MSKSILGAKLKLEARLACFLQILTTFSEKIGFHNLMQFSRNFQYKPMNEIQPIKVHRTFLKDNDDVPYNAYLLKITEFSSVFPASEIRYER